MSAARAQQVIAIKLDFVRLLKTRRDSFANRDFIIHNSSNDGQVTGTKAVRVKKMTLKRSMRVIMTLAENKILILHYYFHFPSGKRLGLDSKFPKCKLNLNFIDKV